MVSLANWQLVCLSKEQLLLLFTLDILPQKSCSVCGASFTPYVIWILSPPSRRWWQGSRKGGSKEGRKRVAADKEDDDQWALTKFGPKRNGRTSARKVVSGSKRSWDREKRGFLALDDIVFPFMIIYQTHGHLKCRDCFFFVRPYR